MNRKLSEKADLVGSANVVDVLVGDIEASALLDTGSQVCTVANWFAERHFPGIEIVTFPVFEHRECYWECTSA